MAIIDEQRTGTEHLRPCPECGHPCTVERYCPECGHALTISASTSDATVEQDTVTPPRHPGTFAPVSASPGGRQPRSRVVPIAIAGTLVLAAAVAIVIIVLSNTGSNHGSTYRQQLGSALAPVVSANRAMSTALQAVDGSRKSIVAAQNATSQAQTAVVAARGAVTVLIVPSNDATLSQQVQQALTQENGYVQAVSSTLSNPAAQSASQVRPLVTSAQSAMVPLAVVASGAASSLTGTDNLLSWVAGASAAAKGQAAAAQRKAIQQAAAQGSNAPNNQTASPPSSATPPSSSPAGLTACDQNISVNSSTSCTFADSVFAQYAQDVQAGGGPGSYAVYASSTSTGQTYTDTCNYNPANQIVLCSHGSDLIQFPYWAAEVYRLPGQ